MLRLLLLRHAKSSWGQPGLADFDRPLNARGTAAAPAMGRHMAEEGLLPDRVLCSSARRTRESFAGLAPFLAADLEPVYLREIYTAGAATYLPIIREKGSTSRTLLVIGHNPAIQHTALTLCASGDPDLISAMHAKFPTCGLAVIDIDRDDWSAIEADSGRLAAFYRPRDLTIVAGIDPHDGED